MRLSMCGRLRLVGVGALIVMCTGAFTPITTNGYARPTIARQMMYEPAPTPTYSYGWWEESPTVRWRFHPEQYTSKSDCLTAAYRYKYRGDQLGIVCSSHTK